MVLLSNDNSVLIKRHSILKCLVKTKMPFLFELPSELKENTTNTIDITTTVDENLIKSKAIHPIRLDGRQ